MKYLANLVLFVRNFTPVFAVKVFSYLFIASVVQFERTTFCASNSVASIYFFLQI